MKYFSVITLLARLFYGISEDLVCPHDPCDQHGEPTVYLWHQHVLASIQTMLTLLDLFDQNHLTSDQMLFGVFLPTVLSRKSEPSEWENKIGKKP